MQTRHRTPTIFNISMVDVLCCALGCVILLWLLNLKEAKEKSAQAGSTSAQLTAAENELQNARAQAADLQKQSLGLRGQLDEATRLAADTNRRLQAAETARDKTLTDLTALRAEKADADDRLAKKTEEAATVNKRLTAANQRVATLELLVREKEKAATAMVKLTTELTDQLTDADARMKKLQGQADRVPDLERDLKASRDKLAAEETSSKGRMDDLADARKTAVRLQHDLDALQDEKKALEKEATRYRFAVENRFAGIELTGKRVVFLVDMSGSMELVDENTPAPNKWQGVRDTVAKLMRSLPGLEKYQIIVFSNNASFLLGNDGKWFDYDAKTSADRAVQALAGIKPHGGTDMYAGLQAAFRFRPLGLDTIYLLSDGLPNMGEGITPEQARTLKETEQGEILGKHIRKTLNTAWNRPLADRPRVRINAVGFFYESPDVGAFLWALARENEGSFVGMSRP